MALVLRTGSRIHTTPRKGDGPLDTTAIVERIYRGRDDTGICIETRTARQRCFPRELTGVRIWTATELRAAQAAGEITIDNP